MVYHFWGCRDQSRDKPLQQQGAQVAITGAWIPEKTIKRWVDFQDLKRNRIPIGYEICIMSHLG